MPSPDVTCPEVGATRLRETMPDRYHLVGYRRPLGGPLATIRYLQADTEAVEGA